MRVKKILTKIVLGVVLLSGFVVFAAPDADAQNRRHRGRHGRVIIVPRYHYYPGSFWYPDYYYRPYYFSSHETQGQGSRDGYDDGKDDARDGKPYSPRSHQDFEDGRTSAYVNAYLRAYADGYRQNARARR